MQTQSPDITILCYSPFLDTKQANEFFNKGSIEIVTYLNPKKEIELARQLGMGKEFRFELNVAPIENPYETFVICRIKQSKAKQIAIVDGIRLLYLRTQGVKHAYKWAFKLRLVQLTPAQKESYERQMKARAIAAKEKYIAFHNELAIYLSPIEMKKVHSEGLTYLSKPQENKYVKLLKESYPSIFPTFSNAPVDNKVLSSPMEVLLIGEGGDFKELVKIVSVTKSKFTNRQLRDKNASPSIIFYFDKKVCDKVEEKPKKRFIIVRKKELNNK